MADRISQEIVFCPSEGKTFAEILGIESPPFARSMEPFRQLEYIKSYVDSLDCKTVIVEDHYIDRDHIEIHSAFYSRNLYPYSNSCNRVHFFALNETELRDQFKQVIRAAKGKGSSTSRREAFDAACDRLDETYLGFCAVRPLLGCPVGRTVLKTFPPKKGDYRREFRCTRTYSIHLLGAELTVKGLAFQQQDAGVSACATTAIWSALHHFRGFEETASATPAQITTLASQFSLPFGRPMPSEGLSLDQMCQSIQALGLSPSLVKATDYVTARGILYSAAMSGMAPILILHNDQIGRHAVTVAGLKLNEAWTPTKESPIDETAARVIGAYIHDDRIGPYLKASFSPGSKLGIDGPGMPKRDWSVTHILIATHTKIRVSFLGIREVAIELAEVTYDFGRTGCQIENPQIVFETLVLRGPKYLEELMLGDNEFPTERIEAFTEKVSLARYVGLIRLDTSFAGRIDVLVDTTGTLRNLHALAVVAYDKSEQAHKVSKHLSDRFQCVLIG